MITYGKKWHHIALKSERIEDGFNRTVRSLSRLFNGITSNHNGDFYCLNCLLPFRTNNALEKHERLCQNNDYCRKEMPTQFNKTLKLQIMKISTMKSKKNATYVKKSFVVIKIKK